MQYMTQVQVETWFLENIANFTIIFGAEIKDSYFLSSKPTDPEFLKKTDNYDARGKKIKLKKLAIKIDFVSL